MSALLSRRDAVEFHAPPLRIPAARVIGSDAEALEIAAALATEFARGAVARDRDRVLPGAELDRMSDAGLFAITVPTAYGGAGVSSGPVARVIALLSGAAER